MFGYVRPSAEKMTAEEQRLFRGTYCGLCHALGRRYGPAERWLLNYDLTFLAVLLGTDGGECCERRCAAHPVRGCPCAASSGALDTAADMSVILSWWQLRDGVTDHGFFGGFRYRVACAFLRRAYRKAQRRQPDFDSTARTQLIKLHRLEEEGCTSMDAAADTFAILLSAAADSVEEEPHRRILQQMFYHLGRWVYLVDAADDLKKDAESGCYNPLALRFGVQDGVLGEADRQTLARTLDRSVEAMAAAFELGDFGPRSGIIRAVVYEGLYAVGAAVLDGSFRRKIKKKENPYTKGRT